MSMACAGDLTRVISCLIALLLLAHYTACSHFRGGTFSYKPMNPNDPANRTVIISFRVSWRRSYSGSTNCDQSTITSGQLIGPQGRLECDTGCGWYTVTVGDMDFKCSDFSAIEDWTTGTRSYEYTFRSIVAPLYQVSFSGNYWLNDLVVGGASTWQLRMYVNLTVRNDTGRLNTAPVTTMIPIVRLKWGCNHTIKIPVTDADKDEVRCRWATTFRDCGGVCNAFLGSRIDERECRITVNAIRSVGFYAVALMIEDYATPTDTQPMSSVPLQFLVYVFRDQSNDTCDSGPEFTTETRAEGSCIGIPHGATYFDRIVVRAGTKSKSIVEISTNSPAGFLKSLLAQFAPQEWYVNVTWTPTSSKIETELFCFTGVEDAGTTTNQRCITLLVGVSPPNIVGLFPVGEVFPDHRQWTITFDKQFVRPTRSSYIRVHRSDGAVVISFDVAIDAAVLYPVGSLGRTIQFTTPISFTEKETYFVTMDPGVAKGVSYCGAESPTVRNSSVWNIKIKDITPPVLTFVAAPSRSGSNVTITWETNENVTTQCTVQTPSQITGHQCNMSWTGTNLTEGFHSIYVQVTDLAGNTAPPARHSWLVDRTPPHVTITSKPPSLSNQTSATFSFECDETCSFVCAITEKGNSPTYSQCNNNVYTESSMRNDRTYVFRVRGTDDVGNQGSPAEYEWKVDLSPPSISNMASQTVDCTSDISPSALGEPAVSDNEGPNITLTYKDIPGSSCSFLRKWTATDQAGNSASMSQTIHLQNPSTPTVVYSRNATIACGSFEDQQTDMRDAINVTHPCDRPITITHTDSVNSIHCATTFTRTWTIADDCGKSVSVQQRIRILALQLPDYPKNGQVNVPLTESLLWPQYPGSVSYNVYLWKYGTPKPSTPVKRTAYRSYYPNPSYPSDTRLLWRIEFVLSSGALIPSPLWGFQTRAFPDFKVEKVLVPANAFSGTEFEVSWVVRNVGKVGNALKTWFDDVYIGKSTNFRSARFATSIQQRQILFQNDGYTSKASVQLRVDEFSVFYVFVRNDGRRRIRDIDRSNNLAIGANPVQVALTPPPNLKVESIFIPSPSFSGKTINIKWTVKNYGVGITAHDSWYDRVYLSKDDNQDRSDWLLGSFYHHGVVSVGVSYTQKQPVTLPNAIFGNYSVLVITDALNDVYEHNREDDNLKSKRTVITLSPPPDLVVNSITMSKNYHTGDTMEIQFNVTNEGLGEPFQYWWRDRVTATHIASMKTEVLGVTYFSGQFPPSSEYSRTLYHEIPPQWVSGQYNITVYTDYRNDVFEYIFNDNNQQTVQITVTQKLPDLSVIGVNGSVSADTTQAYVRVFFSVENNGQGKTSEAPWLDAVFLSSQANFSRGSAVWLGDFPHRVNLDPGKGYHVDTGPIRVNRAVNGHRYIYILTDIYRTVSEQDANNNIGSSVNVTVPLILPDLVVKNFSFLSPTNTLLSDSDVSLNWTIVNNGTGNTLFDSWHDIVYLSNSPRLERNSTLLKSVEIKRHLLSPAESYTRITSVKVPSNIAGTFYFVLSVNAGGVLAEKDMKTNNVASVRFEIIPRPLPDLVVQDMFYVFQEKQRLLSVSWTVANVGNWMRRRRSWRDKVVISSSRGDLSGKTAHVLATESVSARLEKDQNYELSVALQIANTISGTFYVHVVTNADGTISEIADGVNNIGNAGPALQIPSPPAAKLTSNIISSLPHVITLGVPFPVAIRIQNAGFLTTKQTSWTDGIYAFSRRDVSRAEVIRSGHKIKEIPHVGALTAKSSYEVQSNVVVPRGLGSSIYFYAFADIYHRVSPEHEPGNVTQPTVAPSDSNATIVSQGPLPDLQGSLGDTALQTRGGQPLNVTFNLTNTGGIYAQGAWYNAFYLSEDLLVDPFDVKLAIRKLTYLSVNDTVTYSVEIFIPFDTVDSDYYIILVVDSKNTIWEADELNNEASLMIKIDKTLSTDLAVVSVSSPGGQFRYGELISVNWKIRNNGSQPAEGYKCDTIYLSRDDHWQIEDVLVGKPMCTYVRLEPYNGGANQDTPFSITSGLPLVSLGGYRSLVKTRSNILDFRVENNIGAGPQNINVSFPNLTLGSCVDLVLKLDQESSYIVENVPNAKTLIVTVNGSAADAVIEVFVRHSKPATAYQYDVGSKFALSADQDVIMPETIAGTYYVLMRRLDTFQSSSTNASYELCARIAKFKILRVFPTQVAPLGNATLRLEGTLFGQNLQAFLVNSSDENIVMKAEHVYRMSSTEVYATFLLKGKATGTAFHVKLINTESKEEAWLFSSLSIKNGDLGRLKTRVDFPDRFLLDEVGVVTVYYENLGDTDILSPLLSLSVTHGYAELRPVLDGTPSLQYSRAALFMVQASQGPGGILPPKAYGQMVFEARPRERIVGKETFNLQMLTSEDDKPHVYVNSSKDLKPDFMSDDIWAPVWRNFLASVGESQISFLNRMSAVSTLLSVSGRRIELLPDLVQFQLDVANGKLAGNSLLVEDDLLDQSLADMSLLLILQRTYSPLLSKRRDKGVFGVGWMAMWWDTRVTFVGPQTIKIVRLREEIVFQSKSSGFYMSANGKEITVNNTELIFTDTTNGSVFIFDTSEKYLKQVQRRSESITAEYSQNRFRAFQHSSGGRITVKYNDNGLVREAELQDTSGSKTRCFYTYSWDSRSLTSVTIGEQTTRYSYSSEGDLTRVTYPTLASVQYSWDEYGLLHSVTGFNPEDEAVQSVVLSYDWSGQVTITRLPQNDSAVIVFDEVTNIVDVKGDSTASIRFESFESDDQVERTVKQGDQVVMKRALNIKTNTMTVVDANGHESMFLLRENGDVLNITDPGGFVYQNVFNNNSNKMQEFKYPDGLLELINYDESGKLVKFTTRSGGEIRYEYDTSGNIVKKDVGKLGSFFYLYDNEGYMKQATKKTGTIAIDYDLRKRPISVRYPNGRHITYRFNKFQRRTVLHETVSGLGLSYRYDRLNRLSEVVRIDHSGSEQSILKVEYNSYQLISKRTLGNGAYAVYFYNPENLNLVRLENYFPNASMSSLFEFKYDSQGRVVKVNTTSGTWRYKYDAVSQLIESEDPKGNTVRYTYDNRKNRVVDVDAAGNKTSYVTNNMNQYTTAGRYDINYDINGNMQEKANRDQRTDNVKFTFSAEDVVLQTETPNKRCNFDYDALGNLYSKKCGQSEVQYIIDPYGNPGPDIIGQISDGNVTLFVHAEELGLVAFITTDGDIYYYEYNGQGSVIGVLDPSGARVNRYSYDPFGRMVEVNEQIPQDFTFIGQWGVTRDREIKDMYRMRSRHYDAQLGRFISIDPLGFSGNSINLYTYAANNPVMLMDPRGRCIPFAKLAGGPLGALIGAGTSVAAYAASQRLQGKKTSLGGYVSSALTGGLGGFIPGPVGNFVTGFSGSLLQQGIDRRRPMNYREAFDNGINSAISSVLPPFRRKSSKGCGKIIDEFIDKTVKNTLVPKIIPWVKKITNMTSTWVNSLDPNDMIGPSGYGDARFISLGAPLNYKIRFENDPNATAPAKHVIIQYTPDSDLDMRTFRVQGFGFGNFTRKLTTGKSSLQETIDLVSERNVYVRVVAGIDVVSRQVTWDFQSLDPETGEPSEDPRSGFLPPNNGSTGQGFVTFSVSVKRNQPSLTRIDAEASIIFDKNEPIDTPPIYNTIDSSVPSCNISVLTDYLRVGKLAVDINAQDEGSGVQDVDVFYQISGDDNLPLVPLLYGVTDDAAILPLPLGETYKLLVSAVDHVGNRQPVDFAQAVTVDFRFQPSCERYNNCSGHGNCTILNYCVCESRFHGANCSLDYPLRFETPVMDVMFSDGVEDTRSLQYVSAFIPDTDISDFNAHFSLKILIDGVPAGMNFTNGVRNGSRVILSPDEFGDIWMTPPRDFSDIVKLNITAQASTPIESKTTSSEVEIQIQAIADTPFLDVRVPCFHWNSSERRIPVSIQSRLTDRDGSENLTIVTSGLPLGYRLVKENVTEMNNNGSNITAPDNSPGWFITFGGALKPFVLIITAVATERTNGNQANKTTAVDVMFCVTCELVNNCSRHGRCSEVNVCDCEKGFKGFPDCSTVSCEEVNHCSGRGNCTKPNICACEKGFKTTGCSQVSCESLSDCAGHGNCSGPNVCSCHEGFTALNCSEVSCVALNNCSEHGNCTGPNQCTCEEGFEGEDCSEAYLKKESNSSKSLSTAAIAGISVAVFIILFGGCLLVLYCYKNRRISKENRKPERNRSTQVYSSPQEMQVLDSSWVYAPSSEPVSTSQPLGHDASLYSYDNIFYGSVQTMEEDKTA